MDHVQAVFVVLFAGQQGHLGQKDGKDNGVDARSNLCHYRLPLILWGKQKQENEHPAQDTQSQNHKEQSHKGVAVVCNIIRVVVVIP